MSIQLLIIMSHYKKKPLKIGVCIMLYKILKTISSAFQK